MAFAFEACNPDTHPYTQVDFAYIACIGRLGFVFDNLEQNYQTSEKSFVG